MKRVKKSRSNPDKSALNLSLFGPPQLLQGENPEEYAELLARITAAAKPLDAIGEIFVDDVTRLQWEILRWQRLKTNLIKIATSKALESFLAENIWFDLYRAKFEQDLTERLAVGFPDDHGSRLAADLARRCADDEAVAIEEAKRILMPTEFDFDQLMEDEKAERVAELLEGYARRDAEAIRQVADVLAERAVTLDELTAKALVENADYSLDYLAGIERVDRLLIVDENRRNASLREIDRYRVAFGQTVRRSVEDVEEAEFEVIEGPSPGRKTAA
jgi:hypothetical protein